MTEHGHIIYILPFTIGPKESSIGPSSFAVGFIVFKFQDYQNEHMSAEWFLFQLNFFLKTETITDKNKVKLL